MEQFATEEQQVEAIKRFWKEHGTAIIVGAALGLGGLWGWRYYSETQIESKEAASVAYQNAVETFGSEGSDAKVNAFIEENKDSGYASIAGLLAAKQAVDAGDLDAAASHLNSVVTFAENDELLVGVAARRQAVVNPQNTIYSVKRFMGSTYKEVSREARKMPYVVKKTSSGDVIIKIKDNLICILKEYTCHIILVYF